MSVPAGKAPVEARSPQKRRLALIVEDEISARSDLEKHLINSGFDLLTADSGAQAIDLLEHNDVDIVFVKALLPDMESGDLVRYVRTNSSGIFKPIVILVSNSGDSVIRDCIEAGANECLNYQHTPAELDVRLAAMDQLHELRYLYKNSIHEQVVAKQILSVALSARTCEVDGMRVFSQSAAIFSGDLVLSARNPNGGVNILLADFTGHGLSAAIGVLPVADMFSVMTEKGFGPEIIIKNINEKLYTLLPSGMFMAACMVAISSNLRSVCVLNSGMPDVYLLDGESHHIKRRIRSTHIPLGINKGIDKRLEFEEFDIVHGDEFILQSDGLADAVDASGNMFGSKRVERIIEEQADTDFFQAIVSHFSQFCQNRELSDDVTLVALQCGENLNQLSPGEGSVDYQPADSGTDGWRFMIEVSGASLGKINPVPMIIDQYSKLDDPAVSTDKLQSILTALYDNALNHGVLELSHLIDASMNNEDDYVLERNKRFEKIPYGFVRIELKQIVFKDALSLLIRIEDSGRGFDHENYLSDTGGQYQNDTSSQESGIRMVRELCQSMHFQGKGNRVEVIVGQQDSRVADS